MKNTIVIFLILLSSCAPEGSLKNPIVGNKLKIEITKEEQTSIVATSLNLSKAETSNDNSFEEVQQLRDRIKQLEYDITYFSRSMDEKNLMFDAVIKIIIEKAPHVAQDVQIAIERTQDDLHEYYNNNDRQDQIDEQNEADDKIRKEQENLKEEPKDEK